MIAVLVRFGNDVGRFHLVPNIEQDATSYRQHSVSAQVGEGKQVGNWGDHEVFSEDSFRFGLAAKGHGPFFKHIPAA